MLWGNKCTLESSVFLKSVFFYCLYFFSPPFCGDV